MQLYGGTLSAGLLPDRQTPVPIWYQLYRLLQSRIAVGELPANQAIGTEEDLVGQYRVARSTVRRALNELQRNGWLERQGPRKPLVVRERPVTQEANHITGLFSEGFVSRGRHLGIRVRDARLVTERDIAAQLGCKPGALLARISRTFLADELPVALETAWLPASLFPELLSQDLAQMLTTLAETKYGIRYTSARQALRARLATDEEADLLGLKQPVSVMELSRLTLSQRQQPIEYMQSTLRGDQYELVMSLSVNGEPR